MKNVTQVAILAGAVAVSACNLNGYLVGGTVTGVRGSGLVLADNSGNHLSISNSGTFTFSSRIKNGRAYSVTVATQPTSPAQTCTVHNGSGTIAQAAVTHVIVTCVEAGRYAYVANQGAGNISAFSIDSTSGFLTPIAGSPFASTGTQPVAVAVDPNGTHLYAANNTSSNVSVYAINDATGVLTSTGAIATGNGPSAIAIDPTNRFLYVANTNADTVSAFAVNASSGLATAVTGSPFPTGGEPLALKIDPNGNFLYVTNFTGADVTVFAIDGTTGALSSIAGSPFGAGAGADSIAITPAGTYAYVANETAATVWLYSLNTTTGSMTPVSGSPLSTASSPESVAVDPSGRFIFAANVTAKNEIATYIFAPTSGSLTLGTTAAAGVFPLFVVADPVSELVYAANDNSGTVSVYSLSSASGALTAVSGSPFTAGSGARSIAID
jgi:6-phosphogluconolactonase (cycloisomerase 2 family)